MCGRYALYLAHRDLQEQVAAQEWINRDQFVPRYNVAPRSQAPVLRMGEPSGSESKNEASTSGTTSQAQDASFVLHTMKWGLVPSWSKYEDKKLNTTNARSENLIEGTGIWNSIKGRKRCAVVCNGYFEWHTKGKDKTPHFTRHKYKGKLMLMAGLYDSVVLEGETEPLWTFTIVTTAANKDFEWLHDRQPVILATKEALETWLDTSSKKWDEKHSELLAPYSDRKSPLECYKVPKEIGKVGTESPTFVEPIQNRKDGIQAMFAKQAAKPSSPSKSGIKPLSSKRKAPPSSSKTVPDTESDDEVVILDEPGPPSKKPKTYFSMQLG